MSRAPIPRRLAALALPVAALCLLAGCGASVCRDSWLGPKSAPHFAAGFAVGALTSTLAGHGSLSPAGSAALGIGSVAAVGAAKETHDLKVSKTCWSWKELAWVLLGGVVGTAVGTAAGD
jgi:uncharacterized protein YfiM (DUF2279 family)